MRSLPPPRRRAIPSRRWRRPTRGVAAPMGAGTAASSLEPQEHASDADLVTGSETLAPFDAHAVHERAVRAAQVLDPPRAVLGLELRVTRRCRLVREWDVVPGVTAEHVRRAEREPLTDPRRAPGTPLDDERPERPSLDTFHRKRPMEDAEGADEEQVDEEQERD